MAKSIFYLIGPTHEVFFCFVYLLHSSTQRHLAKGSTQYLVDSNRVITAFIGKPDLSPVPVPPTTSCFEACCDCNLVEESQYFSLLMDCFIWGIVAGLSVGCAKPHFVEVLFDKGCISVAQWVATFLKHKNIL